MKISFQKQKIYLRKLLIERLIDRYSRGKKSSSILEYALERKSQTLLQTRYIKKSNLDLDSFMSYEVSRSAARDMSRDLFIILYPSSDQMHTSNHVLNDHVSFLESLGVDIVRIFEEKSEGVNLIKRIVSSSLYLERTFWVVTVLHTSKEVFEGLNSLKTDRAKALKVIFLVNDLWRKMDRDLVLASHAFVDVYLHMDPFSVRDISLTDRKQFNFFPIAGLDRSKFYVPLEKERSLYFSGNIDIPYRRGVLNQIISEGKRNNLKVVIKGFSYLNRGSIPKIDVYASELRNSEICLDLARKGENHWLITGRSLEAIASGCLLLTDASFNGSPLSLLFVQGEEFLSFSSAKELKEIFQNGTLSTVNSQKIRKASLDKFEKLFAVSRLQLIYAEILNSVR